MTAVGSQITSLTIVYSTVYSGADQRKHQSSASLAFMRGIHRGPVDSPHIGPVTRKMFPFDDVIMGGRKTTTPTIIVTVIVLTLEGNGSLSASERKKSVCWHWISLNSLRPSDAYTRRRQQMETFSALLALFPAQRPGTRSFDVFFDLRLNKWLSKQWWDWWFETPLRPLWRHCNICVGNQTIIGSDTCLSPGRRHVIIWTKVGLLLIGP